MVPGDKVEVLFCFPFSVRALPPSPFSSLFTFRNTLVLRFYPHLARATKRTPRVWVLFLFFSPSTLRRARCHLRQAQLTGRGTPPFFPPRSTAIFSFLPCVSNGTGFSVTSQTQTTFRPALFPPSRTTHVSSFSKRCSYLQKG